MTKTEEYLKMVDINEYKNSDLMNRNGIWYVDVAMKDGKTKLTNFRFYNKQEAEEFMTALNEAYYTLIDKTKYSHADIVLSFIIGLITGIATSVGLYYIL
jgi:hypothetical protein